MSFGFYILRHVSNEETNELWQHCYQCIRKFHQEKIIIIDDNSKKEYLSPLPVDVELIESDFPGRGEILPYYYFHRDRPFDIAIMLHDSMFLTTKLNIQDFQGLRFLWKFEDHRFDVPPFYQRLILLLQKSQPLLQLSTQPDKWVGCFSVMSICHWNAIDFLHKTFNLFHLLKAVVIREDRMGLERCFSLCCHVAGFVEPKNAAIFGDISNFPRKWGYYSWKNYKEENYPKIFPIVKVWVGR